MMIAQQLLPWPDQKYHKSLGPSALINWLGTWAGSTIHKDTEIFVHVMIEGKKLQVPIEHALGPFLRGTEQGTEEWNVVLANYVT